VHGVAALERGGEGVDVDAGAERDVAAAGGEAVAEERARSGGAGEEAVVDEVVVGADRGDADEAGAAGDR
jgi:hypothetical protein